MFHQLALLWWLAFFCVIGLCVGSFTNVLIYRLPLGRSLSQPRWSACPHCNGRIRWVDNVPVISFLRLGGRCRQCRQPISTRYPIVEMAMAMIFVLLLDAFVIMASRQGLSARPFITDRILGDWPILLAHLILFTCLFAMSAIDLEHYWVDVRFTYLVSATGFVLHAIWTPVYSVNWIRPGGVTAAASLAALVGLGAAWLVLRSIPWDEPPEYEEEDDGSCEEKGSGPFCLKGPEGASHKRFLTPFPSPFPASHIPVWLFILVLGLMVVTAATDSPRGFVWGNAVRGLVPLVVFFVLIVAASGVPRESDQEIAGAIEEERFSARRAAVEEFFALLPALFGGGLVVWLLLSDPQLSARVSHVMHQEINVRSIGLWRHWQPLQGLATAASGFIIGGALGWAVRIIFTLIFGKEAMGSGDIHLMAATGCVAGWPVVVIGFFLACLMAILGWVLVLPRKRTPAIPLGPWLAIAFLVVVLFYDSLVAWGPIAGVGSLVELLISKNSQVLPLEFAR